MAALARRRTAELVPLSFVVVYVVWFNLTVRNPIAHGAGISDAYAGKLLAHWGPKISAVFARLGWLAEIALWTRDPDGFKRLNGPNAEGSQQDLTHLTAEVVRIVPMLPRPGGHGPDHPARPAPSATASA